jgi:hypothetical protein
VDDIRKAIAKVAESGGKVLGEPMEIPGVGLYVAFMDTEGNRVSMLQPTPPNAHASSGKVDTHSKSADAKSKSRPARKTG